MLCCLLQSDLYLSKVGAQKLRIIIVIIIGPSSSSGSSSGGGGSNSSSSSCSGGGGGGNGKCKWRLLSDGGTGNNTRPVCKHNLFCSSYTVTCRRLTKI